MNTGLKFMAVLMVGIVINCPVLAKQPIALPLSYQGLWVLQPETCEQAGQNDRLVISKNELDWGETKSVVKTYTANRDGTIIANLKSKNSTKKWTTATKLYLNKDGKELTLKIIRENGKSVKAGFLPEKYQRCG